MALGFWMVAEAEIGMGGMGLLGDKCHSCSLSSSSRIFPNASMNIHFAGYLLG